MIELSNLRKEKEAILRERKEQDGVRERRERVEGEDLSRKLEFVEE